jgi:predicted ATP-grasp superfamily ATP-dependent carboligase
MHGVNSIVARLSHAANSRLVDQRYHVPSPEEDWRAGRIQKQNTEREDAYITAVIKICEMEKIDTIFPSFDPQVYVFSKNKHRFEKMGIVIPVPDYEIVITPLDKYATIRAAQEVGFPCPRTYLPKDEDELRTIAREMEFPLVIKPRFTAAGSGTTIVRDFPELCRTRSVGRKSQPMPILQEYVPGQHKADFHLVIDQSGELKSVFSGKKHRSFRMQGGYGTGQESTVPNQYLGEAASLMQKLGWWGAVLVETKLDARDHIPKLMEINPRFGNRLWVRTELGVNEPLMCIRIARREYTGDAHKCPPGKVFVDPVEDILLLGLHLLDLLVFKFRVLVLRKEPLDPLKPPTTLQELFCSYKHTYFSRKKVFNPYFRHFFQDPLVAVLWWIQYSLLMLRAARRVGR